MAEGYNVPKDEGYQVSTSYATKKTSVVNSGYGGEQGSISSLPIYQPTQQQTSGGKSRCPRGAQLGSIGSCCGWECTRACAIPGD